MSMINQSNRTGYGEIVGQILVPGGWISSVLLDQYTEGRNRISILFGNTQENTLGTIFESADFPQGPIKRKKVRRFARRIHAGAVEHAKSEGGIKSAKDWARDSLRNLRIVNKNHLEFVAAAETYEQDK